MITTQPDLLVAANKADTFAASSVGGRGSRADALVDRPAPRRYSPPRQNGQAVSGRSYTRLAAATLVAAVLGASAGVGPAFGSPPRGGGGGHDGGAQQGGADQRGAGQGGGAKGGGQHAPGSPNRGDGPGKPNGGNGPGNAAPGNGPGGNGQGNPTPGDGPGKPNGANGSGKPPRGNRADKPNGANGSGKPPRGNQTDKPNGGGNASDKRTTRDPDLPARPKDIADLFIADSYRDPATGVVGVDWFCRPDGNNSPKICDSDSRTAFSNLVAYLAANPLEGKPRLLRAGKARDDCKDDAPLAMCGTGVPAETACVNVNDSAYCALHTLKTLGINPGVVVGARDTAGGGRSIKDIAWQACQIHVDDGEGLYDYLFLDQAAFLGGRLRAAVKYINEGRTWDGHAWVKSAGCSAGWDVITNDNGWRGRNHQLDTQAWGHAKHYGVAESIHSLKRAADKQTPAVTAEDIAFIKAVNSLNPPGALTTGPVLRAEVSEQTDYLSRISPARQCRILALWAAEQTARHEQFAALFPLYNAGFDFPGTTKPSTAPYDSWVQGTALRQLDLLGAPGGPPSVACPG